ncbi:MAG TPA: hypothetical protein VG897_15565 [Terriglobales bacterium]|nr:hypothetical protein [Terriglobales bacterium]
MPNEDRPERRQQLPRTIEMKAEAAGEFPDYRAITFIATFISLAAFFHYLRAGELLLYGDAVAHMNIARRVVDSRTPGPLQLGTVWLPLPHVLMLPFIWSTSLWSSGVAGAIPSMAAFVASVVGMFRLVWKGLSFLPNYRGEARLIAWFAALVYALNPNLLYLQSTAMTELIYLATYVWATVYISEFAMSLYRGDDASARRALVLCAIFLCLGALTRYDGWFAATIYSVVALALLIAASLRSGLEPLHFLFERSWRRAVIWFVLILAITPAAWFTYNALTFGDPLSFARGPYSARAIEERTTKAGDPHHPGWESPRVAALYFGKSAELNVAATERAEKIWLYAALLGAVMTIGFIRPLWAWLLLWVPVPFYAISMAWGGVPIFLPTWWPFSYYNVRYGTQLIPALVVFGSVLLYLFLRKFSSARTKYALAIIAIAFVGVSYYGVWHSVPISLREARVNSVDRIAIEKELAFQLEQLPPSSTVLIYLGEHGGALQRMGFPLKRTINEGNYRYWKSALMNPARMADYVIATDDDPVAQAIKARSQGLTLLTVVTALRQSPIRIYRSSLTQ